MYTVFYSKKAQKNLSRIPQVIGQKISKSVASLREVPRPDSCRKLHGFTDSYRLKVASYRVIYEISDVIKIVLIVRVGHRKDVYRGFE